MLGELVGIGREAEIYAWGDGRVLKLFFPRLPAEDAQREADLTRMVHEVGIAVPMVYDVITHNGRAGIIFEHIKGTTLTTALKANPVRTRYYARLMADLHTQLHSKSQPKLPSQRETLIRNIDHAPYIDAPLKDRVVRHFASLPDDNRVCHMDFHPENVMTDGTRTVVIDWVNAKAGNPLADVARSYAMIRYGQVQGGIFSKMLINSLRMTFLRAYLNRYMHNNTITFDAIKAWVPAVATARLREDIPGDKEALLPVIESTLVELGY